DGRTAGVTIVGPEGVVGLSAAGGDTGLMEAHVLVPGVAQSMPAERFRAALKSSEVLQRVVTRYAVSLLRHLAQTVACHRVHTLSQRAVGCLLLPGDRIGRSTFPLTQESFADLLGVSRPAVSTVGARFAREGAAEFRRATVHILDERRLEKASCECLTADREALEPLAAPAEGSVRIPRHLPRTPLGLIRPEMRRARGGRVPGGLIRGCALHRGRQEIAVLGMALEVARKQRAARR